MSFEAFQPSILPAWLQGPVGLAYAATLGRLKDQLSNDAIAAATAGMPQSTRADCLPAVGYERQLAKGPAESDAQYAERLRTAWDAWKMAGTPLGMLLQFEILYPGVPIVIIQQAKRAFQLNPDTSLPALDRLVITPMPAGWTFDDNGGLPPQEGFWSRFTVLFPGPLPPTWVDIESPPTDGTFPSKSEVNQIIAVGNKWRPAKALWVSIIVVVSGRVWDWPISQAWDDPGLVWNGGSTVEWQTTPYT